MSTESLRAAALAIRADHQSWHVEKASCGHPDCEHSAFMRAVAEWLDAAWVRPNFATPEALAVAVAYLDTNGDSDA